MAGVKLELIIDLYVGDRHRADSASAYLFFVAITAAGRVPLKDVGLTRGMVYWHGLEIPSRIRDPAHPKTALQWLRI